MNPNANTHSKTTIVWHSCEKLSCDTLVGHSCRALLWDTLVRHTCGKLLWALSCEAQAILQHSCGTLLWKTLMPHSCGTPLRDTLAGDTLVIRRHPCGTLLWNILWNTLAGHSCRRHPCRILLWDTLMGDSRATLFSSCQRSRTVCQQFASQCPRPSVLEGRKCVCRWMKLCWRLEAVLELLLWCPIEKGKGNALRL